jgi:hypothetical protein
MSGILDDDNGEEQSFSVHSYISGAGSDDSEDENIENNPSFSQDKERWMAIRKTVRQYKAGFVLNALTTGLDSFIADTMQDLNTHENNKIQRYNRPHSSIFDWFKTSNKIHPALTMKPLPAEQAEEFALVKEILDSISDYIFSKNNLDLMIKAIKNVTCENDATILDTGDPLDRQMSLWNMIDNLKRGNFHLPTDDEAAPGRKIKDSGILKVLRQAAQRFSYFGLQTEQFLSDTVTRVDGYVHQKLDETYNEFIKTNPKAAVGVITHDEKVHVLLSELSKPEFVTMLRNINTGLISYKSPQEPEEKPSVRRNNWM